MKPKDILKATRRSRTKGKGEESPCNIYSSWKLVSLAHFQTIIRTKCKVSAPFFVKTLMNLPQLLFMTIVLST